MFRPQNQSTRNGLLEAKRSSLASKYKKNDDGSSRYQTLGGTNFLPSVDNMASKTRYMGQSLNNFSNEDGSSALKMPRHLHAAESRYESQDITKKAMLQNQTLNNKSDFFDHSHTFKHHEYVVTSKKRIKDKFGSTELADYTSGAQTINKAKTIHRRTKYNQSALSTIGARPIKENPKIKALALENMTNKSDHVLHVSPGRHEQPNNKRKPGVKTMTECIHDESPHRLASTRQKNLLVITRA